MVIKKINSIGLALATVALLTFSSCEKFFGDVNVDPNAPIDASPAAILLTAETRLVYTIGGDFSRFGSVFTQHVDGYDRQFAGYQNYTFVPGDFGTAWSNLYSGVLADLKQLKLKADAGKLDAYGGVARVLEAHSLMMLTDYFGDVPYSNGLDAEKTFQPTYDTQAQLYTTILALLTEARTKLATPIAGANRAVGNDIIYGGKTAQWIKYANVLAARAYLHQGKLDAGNYAKALAELAKGGFGSSADDARFGFVGGGTADAPWSQYNGQRQDILVGARYVKHFTDLADPRKATYGAALDEKHPIFTPTQAVALATYTEQKFIEAECKLKIAAPDAAGAKAAMLEGIKSSFAEAGVTDAAKYTAYIAQATVNPATVTMNQVMLQKYLALFADPEVFNDWRRTGIPALTPNLGTFVPRRFLYPQSELDLNTNAPKGTKLSDRVGWDK
jgi:Starch-binding associating with outer membrane/Susd and RagB outer membrane lipoprotein